LPNPKQGDDGDLDDYTAQHAGDRDLFDLFDFGGKVHGDHHHADRDHDHDPDDRR
jgi:hypothetical protein